MFKRAVILVYRENKLKKRMVSLLHPLWFQPLAIWISRVFQEQEHVFLFLPLKYEPGSFMSPDHLIDLLPSRLQHIYDSSFMIYDVCSLLDRPALAQLIWTPSGSAG